MSIQDQIQKDISENRVVLFMKGNKMAEEDLHEKLSEQIARYRKMANALKDEKAKQHALEKLDHIETVMKKQTH